MKNSDAPAMPVPLNPGESLPSGGSPDGLTKREYFIALAMQGLCVNQDYHQPEHMAHDAVMYADAVMQEMEK